MARGDSIIRVSIIGDATKLIGAVGDANKATGGLLTSAAKTVGGTLLALGAIRTATDIAGDALGNADRFADALTRIEGTTSPEFAQRIRDISGDLSDIGLSAPEVAEMAAVFADFATAAGVSQPLIEKLTPDLLTLAAAIAATTGKTVDEVITDIGKAASGNQRAVSDLGVVVDKALSPDATLLSILEQLNAKFPDAKSAADDFAGAQDELNAKWETFTTRLGEHLEGPLEDLLDWMNTSIERLPEIAQSFEDLGKGIEEFARNALGALGKVADIIGQIFGSDHTATFTVVERGTRTPRDSDISDAQRRENERNGLTGTMGN